METYIYRIFNSSISSTCLAVFFVYSWIKDFICAKKDNLRTDKNRVKTMLPASGGYVINPVKSIAVILSLIVSYVIA